MIANLIDWPGYWRHWHRLVKKLGGQTKILGGVKMW